MAFRLTLLPCSRQPFLVWINARTRVMGMMAKVRVSFTVTALSNVAVPSPHMLSQVAAAAVMLQLPIPEISMKGSRL